MKPKARGKVQKAKGKNQGKGHSLKKMVADGSPRTLPFAFCLLHFAFCLGF
jgi:hypothetical protein